ncbi:MAG: hypothetical protein AB7O96_10230 [Pseudobdellovibrionaceae bacterium]
MTKSIFPFFPGKIGALSALILSSVIALSGWAQEPSYDLKEGHKLLLPYVSSLSKPISIFHWEKRDTNFSRPFNPTTQEGALRLAHEASQSFLKTSGRYGFYFATDPIVSHDYAYPGEEKIDTQAPYHLMVLKVPTSVSFLVFPSEREESKSLSKRLRSIVGQDCAIGFFGTYGPTGGLDPGCDEFKKAIFQKLGVIGIRYGWRPSPISSKCAGKDRSAFIITDGSWIEKNNFKSFHPTTSEHIEERTHIQQLMANMPKLKTDYDRGIQLRPEFEKIVDRPLWDDIEIKKPLDDTTKLWARQNLLNCQNDFEPVR